MKSHSELKRKGHVKVSGGRSPFDGDWIYWGLRGQKDCRRSEKQRTLLRMQKGCCAWCGLVILPSDVIEIDHRVPRSRGGIYRLSNMQLLQRAERIDETGTFTRSRMKRKFHVRF